MSQLLQVATRSHVGFDLYANPELAGGADSGPIGGNNPPTSHTLGFRTVSGNPEDQGGGVFHWHFNAEVASGRCYLVYELTNNPGLTIGNTYRISWEVENLQGSNYGAALNIANTTDITIIDSDTAAIAGTTSTLFAEFTVDGAGFAAQFRVGVGTTSNNTTELVVSNPQFVDITNQGDNIMAIEELNPSDFDQGIPFTASGAVSYENLGVIDHYHQGLPFTAAGRLAVALAGTVTQFGSGAAPFDASGRLVMAVAAPVSYIGGVGFDATGRIVVRTAPP